MNFVRFVFSLLLTALLLVAQNPRGAAARAAGGDDPASELAPELKKVLDVLSVVQRRGAEQVTPDKLLYEGAIPSMLRRLDPHTQFFEPAQFDQLKQMEA